MITLTFTSCAIVRHFPNRVEVVVDDVDAERAATQVLTDRPPDPLSRQAAAKRLGMSVRSLNRHMSNGHIQYRRVGRRVEFLPDWIESFRNRKVIHPGRVT